jgi:hypothetical protein
MLLILLLLSLSLALDTNLYRPDQFIANTNRKGFEIKDALYNDNEWITVLNVPSSVGYIEKLWYAIVLQEGNARTGAFRITFNNATVPQFGGFSGINVEVLFGVGYSQNIEYNSDFIGVVYNSASEHAGYFDFLMPFTNGFKVEYLTPYNGGNQVTTWFDIDYSSGVVLDGSVNWVLNAAFSGVIEVPSVQFGTLLNVSAVNRIAFLGSFNTAGPAVSTSDEEYLEGLFRIYTDCSETPSLSSSGTEDYYSSSNYFSQGPKTTAYFGWPMVPSSSGSTPLNFFGAYRFYPYDQLPQSSSCFVVQWQNGVSSSPPSYSCYAASGLYWYSY